MSTGPWRMEMLPRSKDEGPGQKLSRKKDHSAKMVKVWEMDKLEAFKSLVNSTKKEGERERKTLS